MILKVVDYSFIPEFSLPPANKPIKTLNKERCCIIQPKQKSNLHSLTIHHKTKLSFDKYILYHSYINYKYNH